MKDSITNSDIPKIKELIKAQKWDRGSYEYVLNHMFPYRFFNDSSIYKKSDLIELFYDSIVEKWHCIRTFTTFKDLN